MNVKPDVLLVDDAQADVKLTLYAFSKLRPGHQIQVFRDGAEVLEFLFGDGDRVQTFLSPSLKLILLDLKLPKINGFEVLKAIKSAPETRSIPVVILTSSNQELDVSRSYQLGANSYIQKPVDFDAFREVVQKIEGYWLQVNQPPPIAEKQ
jgi:two-component system response regulator